MRTLRVQQLVSLDGHILEQDSDFWGWWAGRPDDGQLDAHFVDALRRAGTHIMGRVTYEAMAAHWPSSPEPVAPIMNDVPKVVFSSTLTTAGWPESRIAGGDVAEEIARLKSEAGGDIVAHGGVSFVQSLAALDVVDEYQLYVYPVATGTGRAIFAAVDGLRTLRLASSKAFPSGVVELVYT